MLLILRRYRVERRRDRAAWVHACDPAARAVIVRRLLGVARHTVRREKRVGTVQRCTASL